MKGEAFSIPLATAYPDSRLVVTKETMTVEGMIKIVYELLKDKLNIAKITFSSGVNKASAKFETHNNFTLVTESNIENIKSYFENFNGWVEHQSYYDNYDFYYQSQIKEGDYYYIVSKEGEKSGDSLYGKYDNYEVYYVDLSKCILYYIHSNN